MRKSNCPPAQDVERNPPAVFRCAWCWLFRFYLSAGLAVWAVALVALWALLRRGL